MSIMNTLTNPWVLGIGAAIGAVMLFSRSGGSDDGGAGSYYSPAYSSENMRLNASLVQTSLNVGANLEAKRLETGVTRDLGAYATMVKLAEVSAVQDTRLAETRNATIRALATTNAAVVIDQQNNFARLGMTYIASSTAKYQADTQLAIARVQAKAMKQKGMFDLIGNAIGAGTKVAAMAFGVPPV